MSRGLTERILAPVGDKDLLQPWDSIIRKAGEKEEKNGMELGSFSRSSSINHRVPISAFSVSHWSARITLFNVVVFVSSWVHLSGFIHSTSICSVPTMWLLEARDHKREPDRQMLTPLPPNEKEADSCAITDWTWVCSPGAPFPRVRIVKFPDPESLMLQC